MRNPINSRKHYHPSSLFTVTEGTTVTVDAIDAVESVTAGNSKQVEQGSVVNAIHLEYWLQGESAQPTFGVVTVEKVPSGAPAMTHADASDLFSYANKKNILFTSQGIFGDSNSNPIPILRQWIKIPKGKQRFGLGDKLSINFSCTNPTADEGYEVCGMAIYKEYR